MGLMTDGLHDRIEIITDIMVGVARGLVSPDTLGRWIATFHPEHAKDLPPQQRTPLTRADSEALRMASNFTWDSNPAFPSGSSHDIDRQNPPLDSRYHESGYHT